MIQGATETEKSTKNRKESLKILGYQSRVTTKEDCSRRERAGGTPPNSHVTWLHCKNIPQISRYFLNKKEINWVFTARFVFLWLTLP